MKTTNKVTATHLKQYLALRARIKAEEAKMEALKAKFMDAVKATQQPLIWDGLGRIQIVTKTLTQLDKEKMVKDLRLKDLSKWEEKRTIETLHVSAE